MDLGKLIGGIRDFLLPQASLEDPNVASEGPAEADEAAFQATVDQEAAATASVMESPADFAARRELIRRRGNGWRV